MFVRAEQPRKNDVKIRNKDITNVLHCQNPSTILNDEKNYRHIIDDRISGMARSLRAIRIIAATPGSIDAKDADSGDASGSHDVTVACRR